MFMDKKVTFTGLGKPPGTQGAETGVERNQGLSEERGKHNPSGSWCSVWPSGTGALCISSQTEPERTLTHFNPQIVAEVTLGLSLKAWQLPLFFKK